MTSACPLLLAIFMKLAASITLVEGQNCIFFAYPPDTDQWTMKILQEAHHTYKLLSNDSIDTTVSVYNFQDYWQGTNEVISSLFSCLHFGHYKDASFNKKNPILHAAKLSACARKRMPLARWGVGLTVLLEKTRGNNNIHKMHAIVLLEGDFNYCNKLFFAHQMMLSAQDKGQSNLEDLLITTLKPHLCPGPILHALPVNKHSRHHFWSLLDHNPHGRHLWTLMTLTLLACTIAYTGKENSPLILIRVWSDLYAS
jgi:hypothetical protein